MPVRVKHKKVQNGEKGALKRSDTCWAKSTQVKSHQRRCEVAHLFLYSPSFFLFSGHSESLTQTWALSWLCWAVLSSHTQLSWQEEGSPSVRGSSWYPGCKGVECATCRWQGSDLGDILALEWWLSLLPDIGYKNRQSFLRTLLAVDKNLLQAPVHLFFSSKALKVC